MYINESTSKEMCNNKHFTWKRRLQVPQKCC